MSYLFPHTHTASDTTAGTFASSRIASGGGDGNTVLSGAGTWITPTPLISVSTDRGDSSITVTWATDKVVQQFLTTFTGNRTVTLSSSNVTNGSWFRIVRVGLGIFTLDVGPGLKTVAVSTAAQVEVAYDGSAWRLIGYSAL